MGQTGRDNAAWLAELRREGTAQEAALLDLRRALLGGLRRALAQSTGNDEPFLEDVVQDALLRIIGRLDQFEGRSRFLTWATSIAIRVALTEFRRSRWHDVSLDQVLSDGSMRVEATVDRSPLPDAHLERKALLDRMQAAIDNELTDKQRTALLAELRGMPQDEIARHLGSNRNAIYKLTHDARKRLKQALEAAGYEADDVYSVFAS